VVRQIGAAVVLAGTVGLAADRLGQAPAAQQPRFRSGTRTVPVLATVTDAQQRLVPDLTREDFEILDNGRPVPITVFDSEVRPITVVVMLDTSASMTLTLDLLKAAAEQFLIRLLPGDRAKVGAFNDKIQILPAGGFLGDRDELIAILRNDLQYGNPTRLWDAVDRSLDALGGVEGRRVVLVFTDGDDTASAVGHEAVLERARREEVMVYAIGLESEYFDGVRRVRTRPDRRLRRLAEETGGGYFELQKTAELAPTFTRVAQELHSQYLMGFVPEVLDGKVHTLEVRVKRPGMRARARRSYVAAPERRDEGAAARPPAMVGTTSTTSPALSVRPAAPWSTSSSLTARVKPPARYWARNPATCRSSAATSSSMDRTSSSSSSTSRPAGPSRAGSRTVITDADLP
jgi:Ca-activated chloride channel family protein